MNKKHNLNESFFEKIDSEEKAYFLGLMYSDGYIFSSKHTKGLGIQLQEPDKELLIKFNQCLKSNYPLMVVKRLDENHQNCIRLYGYSKKIAEDLTKQGCFENKTKKLQFPSCNQVPSNLIHHFIRGYFDGDGCV